MCLKTMLNLGDNKVAEIKLSESEILKMAVDELLKDPEASKALDGKKLRATADWRVFKWDDSSAFLTVTVHEVK